MTAKKPIHAEWLATTITRFRNWEEIGYKIHIHSDGSYEGAYLNHEH